MMQGINISERIDILDEEQEFTGFAIINGEVYPEDEIPSRLINDLSEGIDEDMLYEEYRDRAFFDKETRHPKQRDK